MTKTSGWYNADLAALGFLAAVALVVLWPVTLGEKVMLPTDLLLRMEPWHAHASEYGFERVQNPILDAVQQFYPWRRFAAQQVRQDQVPLWNPYSSCGAPFVANNQSAVFYPETSVFYLISPERAFGWATLLYLLLAGGFMYWYLRTVGCRPVAAMLGALPFMLCGFAVGWLAFPSFRSVPAWLPLMLVGHEKMLQGRMNPASSRGPWWLLSAFAIGMQFLAGNLHISFFILLIFAGYVAFRAAYPPGHPLRRSGSNECARDAQRDWPSALYGLAALGLGVLIGAVQLMPVMELALMGSRPQHAYEFMMKHAMIPSYLLAGLMPDIFGNPVDYNHWGQHLFGALRAYVETAWYVGVATLLLAAAALCYRRLRLEWFWAGAALAGFGLAWGTGLYWLAYHLIPPLRSLPGVGRAVIMIDIALAVLAGLGAEAILRKLDSGAGKSIASFVLWALPIALIIGVIGGGGVWFFTGQLEQELPAIGSYTLTQVGLYVLLVALSCTALWLLVRHKQIALVLLAVVLAADLGHFANKFMPAAPAEYLHIETRALAAMAGEPGSFRMMSITGPGGWLTRMPANLPMAFDLENVESSDSLTVRSYDTLVNDARGKDDQLDPDLPIWDALNTKYALSPREFSGRWKLITDYETNVYENTAALPRVYSPSAVVSVASFDLARQWVTAGDYLPRDELVLVGAEPAEQGEYKTGRVVSWSPNAVSIEADGDGRWWALADTYYPGWHAYCGDSEIRIVPANHSLRGFQMPPGGGRVSFIYYPASFLLGAFLTALSIGALGFVMAYSRRRSECDAEI